MNIKIILLLFIGSICSGQTNIKLKSFEPGIPGSLIGVNSSSTAIYTNTVSTLTATSTIAAQSFSTSGTGGAGFIYLRGQSSTPTAPATLGGNVFFNSSGNLSWNRKPSIGTDNFVKTFASNHTADRSYTLKDASGTLAFTTDIPTYTVTAPLTLSTNTFGISQAGISTDGYLSSTDWNVFNNKLSTASASTLYVPYTGANSFTTTNSISAGSIITPIIFGSSSSAGTLSLSSTSNATKGKILFGTSAYDEVNNRLGIGNTSPGTALDVTGSITTSGAFIGNGVNQLAQINGFTNNLALYSKLSSGQVIIGYNSGTTIVSMSSSGVSQSVGNYSLTTAGSGLQIKEGTNATLGSATLASGTVTISTTKVTANSRIFISIDGVGTLANLGTIYEDKTNRVAGTSFIIKSSNVLDNSSVIWWIVEPL